MDNVRMWVSDDTPMESQAYEQIKDMATLPILAGHIAIMPDVHWGKGATVGSVIPTRGAIVPASVGVDIGCGMAAVQTSMSIGQLPDSLKSMRTAIEAAIPVGFNAHDSEAVLDRLLRINTHVGDTERCSIGAERGIRHYSREHGYSKLHCTRLGQPRLVLLVFPWGRSCNES